MRPLFECFRWRRPTYAIDFPGYGLSDRCASSYSCRGLALLLGELLRKLRTRHATADVVALDRGSEPAARVALEEPGLMRSLAVLEPSGLFGGSEHRLPPLAARAALLLGDRAARGLFALMTMGPSVRRSFRRRFHGAPDAALVEYARLSARVAGAYRAPLTALATSGVRDLEATRLYHALTLPVLLVHDVHGPRTIELEAFLRGRANRFAARVSPSRGMPQFERRLETVSTLDRFWQSLSGASWDQATR
jgi:pimeloyl-ACP methyl ester carboxylesterase